MFCFSIPILLFLPQSNHYEFDMFSLTIFICLQQIIFYINNIKHYFVSLKFFINNIMLYMCCSDILFSIILWNLFMSMHVVLVHSSFLLHTILSYEYTNVSLHFFCYYIWCYSEHSSTCFSHWLLNKSSLALYLTRYCSIPFSKLRINLSKRYLDVMPLFPHLSLFKLL